MWATAITNFVTEVLDASEDTYPEHISKSREVCGGMQTQLYRATLALRVNS
jgi:hypothetical protein